MNHLRVFIVDGHEPVREKLAARLSESGLQVIGHTGNPEEAIRLTETLSPDLVLVDIRSMANNGAPALCTKLAHVQPKTSIVILTSYVDDEVRVLGTEAGVSAYLQKTIGSRDLAKHLRDIATQHQKALLFEGR